MRPGDSAGQSHADVVLSQAQPGKIDARAAQKQRNKARKPSQQSKQKWLNCKTSGALGAEKPA